MGDRSDNAEGGRVYALIVALLLTAGSGLIAYSTFLDWALDRFEESHDMGTCVERFLFWSRRVACEASQSDLSWATYLFSVVLPTLLYLVAYPIVGRFVVETWNILGSVLATTIGVDKGWFEIESPLDIVVSSVWPVVAVLIPFQLIGILIATVYRSVWD